ncbi:hypothetical protein GGI07_003084 [Coemansia sp. Benny D115]|nr:hypothetical protein GGI07_003084 [Coemansia sp. Benny D115]
MAVNSDQAMGDYTRTVDYIRKLCEGEDTAEYTQTGTLDTNGFLGDSNGVLDGDDSRLSAGDLTQTETLHLTPILTASTDETLSGARARANARTVALSKGANCANGTNSTNVVTRSSGRRGNANGNGSLGGGQDGVQATALEDEAHDLCGACGQAGEFICCERCPRVFHFLCLNPPMSPETVQNIDHWYCRECNHLATKKRKSRAHHKNIFYPLISSIEYQNPQVFAVPEEIRRQFDGIEADVDGTFINTRSEKPLRSNLGPANRDFTRLVDDHNETILCYRCGLSALHGLVIKCDYCPLSWHWDCLDPPLCAAPPPRKRWMCPNHAEHAMRHQHRRFRKERIVDLTDLPDDTRNGGIVDIVDDDPPWQPELLDPKVKYRIRSSRIRSEFMRNCRPVLIERVVSKETDTCSASMTRTESIPGTDTPQPVDTDFDADVDADTEPSVLNSIADNATDSVNNHPSSPVSEWLQSIVAFQQDVARFVMSAAQQAVLRRACMTSLQIEGADSADASTEDVGGRDKIGILSAVATQLLEPNGIATTDSIAVSAVNSAAVAAAAACDDTVLNTTLTAPDQAAENDTKHGDADRSARCKKLLHDYQLSNADLKSAVNHIFVRLTANPVPFSDTSSHRSKDIHTNGDTGDKVSTGNELHSSETIPVSDSAINGFSAKLQSNGDITSSPDHRDSHTYDNDVANSSESDVTGGEYVCNADGRAVMLVCKLLRSKGADALLDFLLSE